MTAHAHDTITPVTTARPARRADAGTIRLSQRDIDGLMLAGEHYVVPLDLLAAALRTGGDRLPAITARWRRAGYAATGRLGPGPAARTVRIMSGLLSPMRYAQVIYLTAPAARPVVARAAASLPPGEQARVVIRDLPPAAFTPEARS